MRALCFDLDGTLLQFTRPYGDLLAESFEAVAGECRPEWLDAYDSAFFECFEACAPDPCRRAFASAAPALDADALVDALWEREREACRPPPGTAGDLARLAAEFRIGVVTNGVRELQASKLAANGLDDHVDAVVASYEAGAHKPDPAPFRLAERRLDADAYAMVGDAEDDLEGGRGAGWTVHRYRGGGFGDLPGALDWE